MQTEQLDLQPVARDMERRQLTEMQLLQIALQNNAAIDVIERIAALVKDAKAQRAEEEFNEAMNASQSAVKLVIPDQKNTQIGKWYDSYKALDEAIRPIYLQHGFSLSFGFADAAPGYVRVICYVSRGSHTRTYQSADFPADGSGPKGGGVLTPENATTGAGSRARRQLLKFIFNIVVDDDAGQMDQDEKRERVAHFPKCQTISELFEHFKNCYLEAEKVGDVRAQIEFSEARDKRKKEIQDARTKS